MKRILISGAGGSAAINFVRGIRSMDEKIYVVGTDCSAHHIHLAAEVDKKYVIPRCTDINYVDELNRIIEKERIDFLHAQPDVEVRKISDYRERIRTRVFLPDKKTVRLCHNKYELIKHFEKRNVPVARNVLVNEARDIEVAFKQLGNKIWLRAIEGAGGKGSLPVEKLEHGRAWVDYWNGWGSFVAEEFLPGRNMAWQGIFKDGELITSLVWERIEYIISHVSPSGITGTPSVARIIENDQINQISMNAVNYLTNEPKGIFSIDFKENERGIPCLTEINPGRFFSPSYMYVEAGVNLPEIYLRLAFDEEVPKLPKFDAFRKRILWIRGIDVKPVPIKIHSEPLL